MYIRDGIGGHTIISKLNLIFNVIIHLYPTMFVSLNDKE